MSTTHTPEQFAALLAKAASNVAPAEIKPPTLSEQLARHRRVLVQYRAKGYTPQQLATFLQSPEIGISASASFLRKFLKQRVRASRSKAAS